ncbi:hypothetical protein ACFVVM_33060 [Nocardia sp. NPDC058176]|uniref:hypothetical protein n=1 Tax=Nocardia sp. NPDC058176 TaxID=3346368 RepID=UPI0036DDDBB7
MITTAPRKTPIHTRPFFRVLVAVQLLAMVAVTGLRLSAGGGWVLLWFIFGGFLVVFAPSVAAVSAALSVMVTPGRRACAALAAAFVIVYGSLLIAAATVPDYLDVADQNGVPIVTGLVTNAEAEVYRQIADIAVYVHLISVVATVALALTIASRSNAGGAGRAFAQGAAR